VYALPRVRKQLAVVKVPVERTRCHPIEALSGPGSGSVVTTNDLDRLAAGLGDRYRLVSELGRGGMATVYLADDLKLLRQVAIKVLKPELASVLGPDRFLREIKIAAQLNHPHIIALYDSGKAAGFLYYVMPYVAGESLRQQLDREHQLSVEDALRITSQVASALSYAHSVDIVHRDIKPENILLTGEDALVTDFGIARAISQVEGEGITLAGLAVGTPAYMAPEQAAGSEHQDQRVDVYALGCVLYEMLTGGPPFTGPNLEAVVRRRQVETPTLPHVLRSAITPEVEEVVMKALAIVPADRFSTAGHMVRALQESASGERTAVGELLRRLRKVKRLAAAAVIAMSVVMLAFLAGRVFESGGLALEQGVVVFAGIYEAQTPEDSLLAQRVEDEAYSALQQVPAYTVAETTLVEDTRARLGEPQSTGDWLDIARDLGYARVFLLFTEPKGDSVVFSGQIWDVASREPTGPVYRVETDGENFRLSTHELVEDLFDLPDGVLSLNGTANPDAQKAFIAASIALSEWSLDRAERYFIEATDLDPEYARAHLELANLRSWRGDRPSNWRIPAERAVAYEANLGNDRERMLAGALFAMSEGDFPRACEMYQLLVDLRPDSFEAWFGLGECHRLDRIVIRDSASPSLWAFRSSMYRSIIAYQEALARAPTFMLSFRQATFPRLARLFFVQNEARVGHRQTPNTAERFAAYPELHGDTVAFVPYPLDDFARHTIAFDPGAHKAALDRMLDIVQRTVADWTAAFPDLAQAHLAHALVLEALGRTASGRPSALDEVTRARQLALTDRDSVLSGVAHLRMVVRTADYGHARALADTLLLGREDPDSAMAYELAGAAALAGRVHLTANLLAGAAPEFASRYAKDVDPRWGRIALPLIEARQRFRAYAAFGVPQDSIRILPLRVDSLLDRYEGGLPARRDSLRQLLMDDPSAWAYDVNDTSRVHRSGTMNALLELQWLLAAADTGAVRDFLVFLDSLRQDVAAGGLTYEGTFHESWIRRAIGDTAGADRKVDDMLDAVATVHMEFMREPQQVAGLVRCMAWRARAAARRGDQRQAREWATRVLILWDGAAPELEPLLRDMRSLTG